MSPAAVPTVSRIEIQQSRELIHSSRALIASAKELIRRSRWLIGQQTYVTIVCAGCQQIIRWKRVAGATRGQISHSICFDCFVPVFRELAPRTPQQW